MTLKCTYKRKPLQRFVLTPKLPNRWENNKKKWFLKSIFHVEETQNKPNGVIRFN